MVFTAYIHCKQAIVILASEIRASLIISGLCCTIMGYSRVSFYISVSALFNMGFNSAIARGLGFGLPVEMRLG